MFAGCSKVAADVWRRSTTRTPAEQAASEVRVARARSALALAVSDLEQVLERIENKRRRGFPGGDDDN